MHGEAKEWLDAFFFLIAIFMFMQSKWSHPWRPHAGLLTVLCIRSHCDVHDNSAASSFAHAPLHACKHTGNSNARAQCTEIGIPKRDGHTYIHTDAKRDAKQD